MPTRARRRARPLAEPAVMAARRKKRPLRPRVPARVNKRTSGRAHAHSTRTSCSVSRCSRSAVLAAILYLGLDGGAVGSWLAGVLTDVVGEAAYVLPVGFVALGGLLLARSDLLDVRPFRLGVGVSFLGLMTLLGKDSGGFLGLAIGGTLAALIGQTGAAIIGCALLLAGLLLVTRRLHGRDPAPDRPRREAGRLGRAPRVRVAVGRIGRRPRTWTPGARRRQRPPAPQHRLLDGEEAYPDVVGATAESPGGAPRRGRA